MKKIGILLLSFLFAGEQLLFSTNVEAVAPELLNEQQRETLFMSQLEEIKKSYPYTEPENILCRLEEIDKTLNTVVGNKYLVYCKFFLNILRLVKEKILCSEERKQEYEMLYSKTFNRVLSVRCTPASEPKNLGHENEDAVIDLSDYLMDSEDFSTHGKNAVIELSDYMDSYMVLHHSALNELGYYFKEGVEGFLVLPETPKMVPQKFPYNLDTDYWDIYTKL